MSSVQSVRLDLSPIVKEVVVRLPVEAAFRLFTADMRLWWPLVTHSVAGEKASACYVEGWTGGRLYEVDMDGGEADWGRVVAWEAPHRLAFTMHPGRPPDDATEVEVTFQPEAGGTRVTLTHRGWERCGPEAAKRRASYDGGWNQVLGRYVAHAASPA